MVMAAMDASLPSAEPTWTTRELLAWTTRHFTQHGIDHPRLAAEMLLAHVLKVKRLTLYTESDRPASEAERTAFRGLVQRASRHEPVDYLVGHTPFFTMELIVTSDVLIPRPSTETLVEHVLQRTRATAKSLTIADVCTGSGAIAIAVAKHLAECRIVATDISVPALDVARRNAEKQGVASRIDFRAGDLCTPLGEERFDYVLCNPPYIDDAAWETVPTNVKAYEPPTALRGGPDGLQYVRPVVHEGGRHLRPGGQLLVEIADGQAESVLALAAAAPGLVAARVLSDHEGLARVVVADAAPATPVRATASAHDPTATGFEG